MLLASLERDSLHPRFAPPGAATLRLGRWGLERSLGPRQSPGPDLLTDAGEEGGQQLERADRVGITPERHPRASVRLVEDERTIGPHWPDLRLKFDFLVGHDRSEPHRGLPDPPERLPTGPERRSGPRGPIRGLHDPLDVAVGLRHVLVEGKEIAEDLLRRPRDRHPGLDLGHGTPPPRDGHLAVLPGALKTTLWAAFGAANREFSPHCQAVLHREQRGRRTRRDADKRAVQAVFQLHPKTQVRGQRQCSDQLRGTDALPARRGDLWHAATLLAGIDHHWHGCRLAGQGINTDDCPQAGPETA